MRKTIIGGALAATLLACYFAPEDDDMIATANAHTRVNPAPAAIVVEPAPPALDIHPRGQDDDLGNAFAKQTWQPATPKKVLIAQAEAAQQVQAVKQARAAASGPPPLPIRFLGRYIDDGKVAYFLQLGDRNVVARVGDKVDDNYSFDSAEGGALTFTYLPLHKQQTLAAGDTN